MTETILILGLLMMLVAALPVWSHSRTWGHSPSGLLGGALAALIVLMLTRGL